MIMYDHDGGHLDMDDASIKKNPEQEFSSRGITCSVVQVAIGKL